MLYQLSYVGTSPDRSAGSEDNRRIASSPSTERSRPAGLCQWALRASRWIVPEENPAGVVYGVITIGALLAAESGLHDSYLDTVSSAVIALALFWLAHSYASVLGQRIENEERLSPRMLAQALAHDWAIVRGAAIPLCALVLAWVLGVAQATAVTAALWSAVASLVAFELLAGLRSRAGRSSISPGELALEASVGIALGVAILALKALLH